MKKRNYALHKKDVERKAFDILDVLRTPYRIDIMQPIYYMLPNLDYLNEIRKFEIEEVMAFIEEAKVLGLNKAKYPVKQSV